MDDTPPMRWVSRLTWLPPLVLYVYTACPTVAWVDGGMLANSVFLLRMGSWVNSHNLHIVLGRLFTLPFDDLAYGLTLFSGVLAAWTVHMMVRAGHLLTGSLPAALVGGAALMLSHTLWWHATIIEVYTLNTAIIATMLFHVVRWTKQGGLSDLFVALFLCGLGISNHVLMILFVPAFLALYLVPSLRSALWKPRVFGMGLLVLLLGMQLWLTEVFRDTFRRANLDETPWTEQSAEHVGDAFGHVIDRASGGRFKNSMFPEMSATRRWKWRGNWFFTLAGNYPSVALPLGLLGIPVLFRRREWRPVAVFVGVGGILQAGWSMNYMIWDMYAFGLPSWLLFGFLVMVGAHAVLERTDRWRTALLAALPTLLLPPLVYTAVAQASAEEGWWRSYFGGNHAYWEAGAFFAQPNKRGYTRTQEVLDGLGRLPEDSHLWISDAKGYFPFRMYHQRVLGRDLHVRTHLVFGAFQDRERAGKAADELREVLESGVPVYVASLTRPERGVLIELYADLEPGMDVGEIRQLRPKALQESFPVYRIETEPLEGVDDAVVYRFVPR